MATRSCIAVQYPDDSIRAIYCHSDGYLSGVGETLQTHYTNRAKTKRAKLIQLGDISSLGETTDKGETVSYRRDRQDTRTGAKSFKTFPAFLAGMCARNWGFEFWYFWNGTEWLVSETPNTEFKSLLQELVTEKLIDPS